MNQSSERFEVSIFTSLRWTVVGSELAAQYGSLTQEDIDLLPYHRDRMLAAAEEFGYEKLIKRLSTGRILSRLRFDIENLVPKLTNTINVYKIRLAFSSDGEHQLGCSLISSNSPETYSSSVMTPIADMSRPKSITCRVYIDSNYHKSTAFTRHKTTQRQTYDEARARLGISSSPLTEAEVLLINDKKQIIEASLCTPYFFRNNKWVTPHIDCGGNRGVTRRLALESGFCIEGIVEMHELVDTEFIWLSNAVRGFFGGRIALFTSRPDAVDMKSAP